MGANMQNYYSYREIEDVSAFQYAPITSSKLQDVQNRERHQRYFLMEERCLAERDGYNPCTYPDVEAHGGWVVSLHGLTPKHERS